MKAHSIESGITMATISAAAALRRKSQSTATTSAPPNSRFFSTVWVVRVTSSVWS
jgi:hypothetical protein